MTRTLPATRDLPAAIAALANLPGVHDRYKCLQLDTIPFEEALVGPPAYLSVLEVRHTESRTPYETLHTEDELESHGYRRTHGWVDDRGGFSVVVMVRRWTVEELAVIEASGVLPREETAEMYLSETME